MRRTWPSPQATSIPPQAAAITVPGRASVCFSTTWAPHSLMGSPVMAVVEAPGQGYRPRIWLKISWALLVQSTGDIALESIGAWVAWVWSWGV